MTISKNNNEGKKKNAANTHTHTQRECSLQENAFLVMFSYETTSQENAAMEQKQRGRVKKRKQCTSSLKKETENRERESRCCWGKHKNALRMKSSLHWYRNELVQNAVSDVLAQ
jgi:hypothetical protein